MCALAWSAPASDALQWSGFALLRGSSPVAGLPFDDAPLAAQVQAGIDWRPTLNWSAHVHLLARDDPDGSRRGTAGVVQGYIDGNLRLGGDRFRIRGGSFFLPTSFENIDALWETPYTITPSALNTWMGEEFRPIGVDVAWGRRSLAVGATLFRGNDTFGGLPVDRGWALRDRWTLLGEHVRVDDEYFTSVSAETDHRPGYAARTRWNRDGLTIQLTHIDNRSDGLEHGDLLNWNTRFEIAGAEYLWNDWTLAAESGWGDTSVVFGGESFPTYLRASYLLVSRRFSKGQASVRVEEFRNDESADQAMTAALLWTPISRVRAGIEATRAAGRGRVLLELRYTFSGS
jgi:hypothetical protein